VLMIDLGGPEGNEGAAGAEGNPAAAVGKTNATATFTPKQKEEIVRRVAEENTSPNELGKEYGISPHSIRDWVKKAGKSPVTPKEKEEIVRLVVEDHTSPQELGKEYGISSHEIKDYVKKAGKTLPARYNRWSPVVTTVQTSTTAAGVVTVDLEELGGKLKHTRVSRGEDGNFRTT
ncbi:MAG: transposase, partial [Gammaproteobacteria bacterium]|nr:transposase [Gammaproteobacteria bacterium]